MADASKSWTANGVDLADVIKRATMEDTRLGAMLTLGIAFGLRKKEMLRIKPWRADKGNSLEIDGSVAKNGRYRNIPFEAGEFGEAQRLALDQAKKVFLAAQSIADFNVRFQSKDKAQQLMANLNNIICLRMKDLDSANYISEMFGEVSTRSLEVGFSTGSGSSEAFTEFRSNVSRNLKTANTALVSPSLLTRLPPLHYFAFIAGRNYYKGCLEFIEG